MASEETELMVLSKEDFGQIVVEQFPQVYHKLCVLTQQKMAD